MDLNEELLKIKSSLPKEDPILIKKLEESYIAEASWLKNKILEEAKRGCSYYMYSSQNAIEKEVIKIMREDPSFIKGTLKIEMAYFDEEPETSFENDFYNDWRVVEFVMFTW